jgi:ATP-dependent DNA helicase DinG
MRKRAGVGEAGTQVNEDAETLARRAAELRDHLTFLLEAADASFVYFLETRNRGVFLRAAPIDVSRIINEMLFNRMRATVMTSATLTVEGSFDYVKGRLGVPEANAIRVQSEFDFSEQAILYLPKQMPPPKSPQYGEAVAREVR